MKNTFLKHCVPAGVFAALSLTVFAAGAETGKNDAAAPSRPAEKGAPAFPRAPLELRERENAFTAEFGENSFAEFSKTTGTLSRLVYGGKEIIADGNGPALDAFRAVVNNDGWAYGKWFQAGLWDLRHEVVGVPVVVKNADGTATLSFVVRSRGKNAGTLVGDPRIQNGSPINGVPTEIRRGRELGENDLTFTTHQIWTVFPDGSVELAANITSNNPAFDLPRLGYALGVPAEFSSFTYYGRGPQENYSDRESGAFVGVWSSPVAAQFTDYTKPQEAGNHEDVRWCALTDADGNGAIFVAADGAFSAQALPVTALDLLFAPNPFALDEKIAQSRVTTLRLDAGVRGLGGASCGPDTEKRDKIFAEPTDFGFIIRPVTAGTDLRAAANVSPAGAVPIAVTRDAAGALSVASKKRGGEIFVSLNGAPARKYSESIPFRNGGSVSAWFAETPDIRTEIAFPKIDKVRASVVFASSENGGNEAAANLTDGDPSTIWHTAYSVTQANYPHWIDFDVGETKKIKGVSYLPRQDGGTNGDVGRYEIFVSLDGENWGEPVASGEFSAGKAEKRVLFAAPVEARFVRFRALSSQNGAIFASGAEFSVLEE